MFLQIVGAFAAVIALGVILGVPQKFIYYTGIVGACGWLVYLICDRLSFGIVFQNFAAALVVALISHSFARIFKAPVTVFLITGIIPLVPGTGMYRTLYQLLSNNGGLAGYYFTQTMQIAGVIALAIFIMDTIFRLTLPASMKKTKIEESGRDE